MQACLSSCFVLLSVVNAFEVIPRQFIQLANQERFPAAFVSNWPTWILDQGSLIKIPDTDGFVNPSSIDELWQPVDLKFPDTKLAVGLHVRDGIIRHIMPALDLSFHGQHRNRGLCSVPRAHTWMDFSTAAWQDSKLIASQRKMGEEEWNEVCTSQIGSIEEVVLQIMPDFSETLICDGSHIIHIPLKGTFLQLKSGIELRLELIQESDPFARLQVAISPTSPGSESDYIPDVYKPIFENMEYRRQAYSEMMKRKCK